MLGRMSHFQAVLKDRDKLFDLTIVQHPRRDASLGRESLEEVDPLRPFSVTWYSHWSLVGFDGDGKLVFGNEVECALA